MAELKEQLDEQGGIVPPDNMMEASEEFDFVTLPEEIPGTNCRNCRFAKEVDEENEVYVCTHPSLYGLHITERNCCALWDAEGTLRHWKDIKPVLEKALKERGEHPFHDHLNYQSLEGVDTYYGHSEDGEGPSGWMGKDPPSPHRWIPGRDKAMSWLASGMGGDLVAPPAFSLKPKRKGLPVESGYRARDSQWDWEPIGVPSTMKMFFKTLPPLQPGHQPTLAVDMDGTLSKLIGSHNGGAPDLDESSPMKGAVEAIRRFHDRGWRIIIWTVRDDYKNIKKWLRHYGVPWDYINENPDQPTSSPKIIADYYIDDRAIHFSDWRKVMEKVKRAESTRQPVSADAGHEKLLKLAERGQPELEKFLRLLKYPTHQIKDMEPEELDRKLQEPGPMILLAPPKGLERAQVKVDTDYDGDWSKLLDVVRAAVAVDNWYDLEKAVGDLDEVGLPLARKPKNRFKEPLKNGYRDFLVNYRLPSGMVCEVQFHLKPILQAREKEKEHYAQVRAIKAAMEEEDRDSMTPDELLAVENVLETSRQMFEDAWEASKEGAPDWEEKHKSLDYDVKQTPPTPEMNPQPLLGDPTQQGGQPPEQEEPEKSPYLHWHKYLQKQGMPPPEAGQPPVPEQMGGMGGQPEQAKVRKSPYLHWHKYFSKAEPPANSTVVPVSPTGGGGGSASSPGSPLFTGQFRDRLGRLTCYFNGKKVPCQQKEERGGGYGGGGIGEGTVEDVPAGGENSKIEHEEGGKSSPLNYAIVFNRQGRILENPNDTQFGGFIWSIPIQRDYELESVIYGIKQESIPVEFWDEIGEPDNGNGYWILHGEGKARWLSPREVAKRIQATEQEEWHQRGIAVLKEAIETLKSGKKGQKSLPTKQKWGMPEWDKEEEEIQRTSRELGLDIDEIHTALERGQLTPLPDQIWSRMVNTDSWETIHPSHARQIADERDRNIERIYDNFQDGKETPAPIVLLLPDGQPYLIGGNTRLMASRSTNRRPDVFLADMRQKSFYSKAGPSYTGSFMDASNRRTCIQNGERVPCENFGGQGRGWNALRQEEDLYDAIRKLVDKVKTSGDWQELIGTLANSHPEELQKIIRDHKLSTPPAQKQQLLQFVQQQLQQQGHQIGQQQQPQMGMPSG